MALDINAARTRATRVARSFSPQQMLILAGLTVVSVVGLVALFRWVSQPTMSVLSAGASASEIADITGALDEAGIPYELSGNGTGVTVTQADLARSRLALNAAGVASDGTADGYDLLDNQGLTVSDFKQQVDYKRALEGELANTLMEMDGVNTARVTLSLPEKALFVDDQDDPRASVLIGSNAALDSTAVRGIMQTIASAVPGLTTDNVTVTDTSGRILSVDGMGAGSDPLQLTRKFELATAAQAQTMLDTILGPGKSVVRVSAEMDFSQVESKETAYDEENAVPVATQKNEETLKGSNVTVPGGVAGVTGTTLATANGNVPQDYTKIDQVASIAVGSTETVTKETPGKVTRLSVAVAVDEATLTALDIDPAELETLVATATGAQLTAVAPATAPRDTVELLPQVFDTASLEAVDEATKAIESAESKSKLLSYAETGGAILVLLLSVLFLRKGLKRGADEVAEVDTATLARSAEPFGVLSAAENARVNAGVATASRPTQLAVGAAAANDEDERNQAGDRRALDPATEVLDLIDREPDDVAALLRSWVADRRS